MTNNIIRTNQVILRDSRTGNVHLEAPRIKAGLKIKL